MQLFYQLTNYGVYDELDSEVKKYTRIVNSICLVSFTMILATAVVLASFGVNQAFYYYLFILAFVLIGPFALNRQGKHVAARVYFLVSAYVIICSLPILMGPEVHYQYYLMGGIGMPLIFLKDEIGKWKWVLVFVAIPIWLGLEWWFTQHEGLIPIPEESVYIWRLFNDFLVFCTIASMFAIFTFQNQKYTEEIAKQKEELLGLNRELDSFARTISHDLKTPLAAMEMMMNASSEGEVLFSQNEKLTFLRSCANQMRVLIDDVLTYSRVAEVAQKKENFQLEEAFVEVMTMTQASTKHNISVDIEAVELYGSKVQIVQVVLNLFSNALKHIDKDAGNIVVRAFKESSKFIKVEISDNGPGIATENQQRIFDLYDGVNKHASYVTEGIGLHTVRKLVRKNGGNIGLNSEIGKGSTFWFTWPVSVLDK